MAVKKPGFCWHVHHRELIEWCYNYKERERYIRTHKPKDEQEIRLRLFQPVKGKLPNEVIKAGQAYDKAWQACGKARQVYIKAGQVYDKAEQVCDKAYQVWDKAYQAYYKARQARDKALSDNMSAIEELHTAECTNCPWDGHTIFPNTQQ